MAATVKKASRLSLSLKSYLLYLVLNSHKKFHLLWLLTCDVKYVCKKLFVKKSVSYKILLRRSIEPNVFGLPWKDTAFFFDFLELHKL